jgi:uncharacterized protein YbjQ (UPF0145 family)
MGVIVVIVVLLILGLVIGRARENAHWAELDEREARVSAVVVLDIKEPPPGLEPVHGELVTGSAVIGTDYFKQFMSSWRMIFGGELKAFQTVLGRARREANVRMVEQAYELGARAVINVRYETSRIGMASGIQGIAASEILVYGTAVR